jgi:6-phosphogluconolactonase
MNIRWHSFISEEQTSLSLVENIIAFSETCVKETGRFSIVLTGGKSIKPVYQELASVHTDWSQWHVFWGDERCVPVDDEQRNSKLVIDTWLSRTSIPLRQIHPIPAEAGSAEAVHHYSQLLSSWSTFDLVLLSLGQDGHVASLFPGQEIGSDPESPAVLATFAPPEFPILKRVSLSTWRLRATRRMFILAWGPLKAHAIEAWKKNENLPVNRLTEDYAVDVWCSGMPGSSGSSVTRIND